MTYPRAFNHIGLSVPDVDAAFKWYTEVLGLCPALWCDDPRSGDIRANSRQWPYAMKGPRGRAAGSARFCVLDGLLRGANERFGNLSVPASHHRTLARRPDASKPKTSTYVDENEEDR